MGSKLYRMPLSKRHTLGGGYVACSTKKWEVHTVETVTPFTRYNLRFHIGFNSKKNINTRNIHSSFTNLPNVM